MEYKASMGVHQLSSDFWIAWCRELEIIVCARTKEAAEMSLVATVTKKVKKVLKSFSDSQAPDGSQDILAQRAYKLDLAQRAIETLQGMCRGLKAYAYYDCKVQVEDAIGLLVALIHTKEKEIRNG